MPLAPIPTLFRAQVEFDLPSGLPADVVVNTFHFENNGYASFEVGQAIANALDDFYFEPALGTNQPVAAYMGGFALTPTGRVKVYDLGEEEPRTVQEFPLPRIANGALGGVQNSLPSELAAVVSWQTAVKEPRPNTPGKRGRGRTYIGPLKTTAMAPASENPGGIVLANACVNTLAASAARLAAVAGGIRLVVFSPTYLEFDDVTHGFVDNAFDVQRRRGVRANKRTRFTPDGLIEVPQA